MSVHLAARDNTPLVLITASWVVYVLLFPFGQLVQGPLLLWLLLLNAGTAVMAGVLAIVRNSQSWRLITAILTGTLWLLYAVHWARPLLDLSPVSNLTFAELLLQIARTKARILGASISGGRIWEGVAYAYWEFMPFLHIPLVLYWMVGRSGAGVSSNSRGEGLSN